MAYPEFGPEIAEQLQSCQEGAVVNFQWDIDIGHLVAAGNTWGPFVAFLVEDYLT
jgi:hypothetical protein